MDLITHIALGGVIGSAINRNSGNRNILIGSAAQAFPDIDVVPALWLSTTDNLWFHRGITHSLLALIIMPAIFTLIAGRFRQGLSAVAWYLFFFVQYFIHLFLDCFNTYGIGIFEPFSRFKLSFDTLYVVDPFFSISLVIAFVLLLLTSRPMAWKIALASLTVSGLYLGYTVANKQVIKAMVVGELRDEKISYSRVFTTPTPLNNWLWFAVAEADSGFHIGYYSVFDSRDAGEFHYVSRNESYSTGTNEALLGELKEFSNDWYTMELQSDTLVFNDLRFGQIAGWADPENPFVFHYFLNLPDKYNKTVMQRGRISQWNRETIAGFTDRMFGH